VIAGIKWASGDLNQLMEIKQALPGFKIFSGDDNLTYSAMRLGADGVISVLSNIIPGRIFQFIAYLKNPVYWDTAQKNHYELLDLMKAMFIQTNPIPVKTALAIMYPEIFANEFRSPMTPITNIDDIERLFKALDDHDIIKTSYQETLTLLGMHKNSSESVDN
ncbi:MAG: dihydrodipicolinate synthase family protein, partial [Candidatus Falkowbacteria bacterium]|nr:dihydrodipicolinate synthase family protein [Candidatus Falkowbacteria bacterium]